MGVSDDDPTAEEMSAHFERRNPLQPELSRALFRCVDEALGRPTVSEPENIYGSVQAVLLNSEGDPHHVVAEAQRAVEDFANLESVAVSGAPTVHLVRNGRPVCGGEVPPNGASVDVSVLVGLLQGGQSRYHVNCPGCLRAILTA